MQTNTTNQRGYVMVLSMLILLIITVMSISMAKSFFLEEGMAGNLREKSRAFSAAQAALNYGEWYVANHQGYGVACATPGQLTNATICSSSYPVSFNADASNITGTLNSALPFATYFLAPTSAYLNLSTTGGKDTFYATPGLYIEFLGLDTTNSDYIYRIDAYGYGGSQSTVSIVQSTFMTLAATKSLGGP
jgi:type IV pilus assembly protein PilX